jgi:hypothetical protein
VVSVSPNSASGTTLAFTAVYSDPNGAQAFYDASILINTSIKGVGSCLVNYYPSSNQMALENDAVTAVSTLKPGSSASVSNSQCTLSGAGSSVTQSGTQLTVTYALTFNSSFGGLQNVYLRSEDKNGSNSGWLQKGTWGALAGPPTVVSVSPNSGSGTTKAFTAVYADPNGAQAFYDVSILINTSIKGAGSCLVTYFPSSNQLALGNDTATATYVLQMGSSASVSNSQCTLSGAGSSVTKSGTQMSVVYALTFSSTFGGQQNVYLRSQDKNANSGWVQKGTWGAQAGPPTVVSLSPTSGSGATQSFTAVYSDPNGALSFYDASILINTSVKGAGSCLVTYDPARNQLALANDTATATYLLQPGSSASVSNSQCTLSGAGSSVTKSGTQITVVYSLTFSSAFTGSRHVYLRSEDKSGANSGWVQQGTWTP